jgi:hypothetical protein
MADWQPIETVPQEDGAEVDLWCVHPQHGGMRSANMNWDQVRRRWRDWLGVPLNPGWKPTHWMPLPEPPVVVRED